MSEEIDVLFDAESEISKRKIVKDVLEDGTLSIELTENLIKEYGIKTYEEGVRKARVEIGDFPSPMIEKSLGLKYGKILGSQLFWIFLGCAVAYFLFG